ncbi:glycosyltransferase [Paenibacillus lactis]|uniref:glycosyltransferase n=1 Tax=Paenibacillus lactis TaxID=228574 RepID=UPI00203E7C72|nr:glycosyltransferase [Paenibacillus lactis]MCM3493409.1 glycosyltransferase [Paenibacillus lactis]
MQKYDHELDMMSENSAALVLREVPTGSKVLELGPATGYMTRYMKEELNCSVYCIEYDPSSAEEASVYSEKMIVSDLEDFSVWTKQLYGEKFDYILCVDVLEHLRDPHRVLREVVKYLEAEGSVIASIPNISHNAIIMSLLQGEFKYNQLGLLDNTHVKFFTKESIIEMLSEAGLEIVKMKATKAWPEETEFHKSYEEFPEAVQDYLLSNPEGHAYQYISVAKKISSSKVLDKDNAESFPISTIEPIYDQLQVFWSEDGQFSEEKSVQCYMHYDNKYHVYKISLPAATIKKFRIDPGSWSAFINIKSVKLIKKDGDYISTIQDSSAANGFAHLSVVNNMTIIDKKNEFKVFAFNRDPQMIWDLPELSKQDNFELWVELSALKGSPIIDRIKSVISDYNTQVEDLEMSFSEVEEKYNKLENIYRTLEARFAQTSKELGLVRAEKEALLKEHKNKVEMERQINGHLNQLVEDIRNSRSWRITKPLRYVGSFFRKVRSKLSKFVALVFRRRFRIEPVPLQNVNCIDQDYWETVGEDPSFILKGKFPTGWVVMKVTISAETNVPLKLYWDCGHGMSEQDSALLGISVQGHNKEQTFRVLIPRDAISLRLDPGEEPIRFLMRDLRFIKISKYHVLFDSLRNYTRMRGGFIRSILPLSRKAVHILKRSGLSGLRSQTRRALGLTQNIDMTQSYQKWVESRALTDIREKEINREISQFAYKPLISIIVPVYNVEETWLRKCIESVRNQLYTNWELCLADDASPKKHVREVLDEYKLMDPRIKVVYREKNGHISECSNSALAVATGEFIGLLDHDDELSRDALYENVKMLNMHPDADLIYSDEDKITEEGERHSPFFKPDWSPDLLMSQMYICHFSIYRKTIIDQIGGFRKGYEGSQDYDLALRFTELTDAIYHIPKVLYHWRTIPESTASGAQAKNYTHYAGLKALEDTLKRRHVDGTVKEIGDYSNMFRVSYKIKEEPLVSIIIPTRNMGELLDSCLNSIFSRSLYSNFEVIIIDNGSTEEHTLSVFKKWTDNYGDKIRILPINIPFNYSKLNNMAVKAANGEYILLLNNDIEVISEDWLGEMVGYARRNNTGAVGAKLLYPDDSIQHAGVVMGLGGIAGHAFRTLHKTDPGYFGALLVNRNCSVVTAACLMIKKDLYIEVGGLEEELTVAFNDVDLCLKLLDKGCNNICLNSIELYHHESKSRGAEDTPEKKERFQGEINYMLNKWSRYIERDPYYNVNLSLESDQSYRLK